MFGNIKSAVFTYGGIGEGECAVELVCLQMLNISLRKTFKVRTILVLTYKTNQQIKNIYTHTLNKIKHKCQNVKIALETTKISYVLHVEQMHNKFMLCFSSSFIPVESYSFLTLLVGCSTKHFL